jgi:hypothetical protein
MDIARNHSGSPASADTREIPSHSARSANTTPAASAFFKPAPQYVPPTPALLTPSNPFANASSNTSTPAIPSGHAGYASVGQRGMPLAQAMPPKPPTWSDINYRNERVNDIINGSNGARSNMANAYNAWKKNQYVDALFNFYQGVSSSMRALRGMFGLGGYYAGGMDRQGLAKSWKETASNIDSARRVLDLVGSPLSSFRGLAQTFSDPSSTYQQKLFGIADYMDQLAQGTGLAILRMDRGKGTNLVGYFGYALFTGAAANQGTRQAIKGFQDALRMLHTDPWGAMKTAMTATQSLVTGAQALFEYLADAFDKVGMENQAGVLKREATALRDHAKTLYKISAHLLAAMNVIDPSVIAASKFPKS